jgi:hypothetical protein
MSPFRNRAETARRLRARVERTAAAARRRVDPARWGALARVARFGAFRAARWTALRRVWERRRLRGRARLVHRLRRLRRWLPALEAAAFVELEEHEPGPLEEAAASSGELPRIALARPRIALARLFRGSAPRETGLASARRSAVSVAVGRAEAAVAPAHPRLRAAAAGRGQPRLRAAAAALTALGRRRAAGAPPLAPGRPAGRREGAVLQAAWLLPETRADLTRDLLPGIAAAEQPVLTPTAERRSRLFHALPPDFAPPATAPETLSPAPARAFPTSMPAAAPVASGRPTLAAARPRLPLRPGVYLRAAGRRARTGGAASPLAARFELRGLSLAPEPAPPAAWPPRFVPRGPLPEELSAARRAPAPSPSPVPGPPRILLVPPPVGAPETALTAPAEPPTPPPAELTVGESATGAEARPVAIEPSVGSPLQPELRRALERRLGIDLSGVRVHTGDTAGRATRSLRAAAFTLGRHLFFAPRRFAPWTPSGLALLEHELGHVVQQPAGRPFTAAELPPARQESLEVAARAARPGAALRPVSRPAPGAPRLVLAPLSLAPAAPAAPVVPLLAPEDEPPTPAAAGMPAPSGAGAQPGGDGDGGDVRELAEQVYRLLVRRQQLERERRGIQRWQS